MSSQYRRRSYIPGPELTRITTRARYMGAEALAYSANDAYEASQAADALERAGCPVLKTGGYYSDEAAIYSEELRRRYPDFPADYLARHPEFVLIRTTSTYGPGPTAK